MTLTRTAIKAFSKDEDGATAIEYALMVALVGAVIIGGVTALGSNTNDQFLDIAGKLAPAGTP